ncbi:MAG: hypothetical protein H0U74_14945, partial [Bradymonadaceae bacterium]|nr:hypothetical protein [Lujinxingiaceae bacterium]
MSEKASCVTRNISIEDVCQLPASEELHEAAVLFETLGDAWFDELGRKAVVLRKNGYQIKTLVLFFFVLFTANISHSVKRVCNELRRPSHRLLAAWAGLIRFPQQSSGSRFLSGIERERIEPLMAWMLVFSQKGARELLNHAACACRDSLGNPWQLFDLDPTATVLRQRGLLERPEVRARLAAGPWFEVEDSGSGPRRMALDLGELVLEAGSNTTYEDT